MIVDQFLIDFSQTNFYSTKFEAHDTYLNTYYNYLSIYSFAIAEPNIFYIMASSSMNPYSSSSHSSTSSFPYPSIRATDFFTNRLSNSQSLMIKSEAMILR